MFETPINCSKPKSFTGCIMRGDIICANVVNDELFACEGSAPLQIQYRKDFREWLKDRSADLDRSYIRNILKHLNLAVTDEIAAVKHVYAVSVTDIFWIREEGSPLRYDDVKFESDIYFKAALMGDPDIFSKERIHTPEVTNIGSYNKGWKYDNDAWLMYKAGTPLEIWSEIFTSKLAQRLNLDAVVYTCVDGFVMSKNFVGNGLCFEPAKSLIGSDTAYKTNIEVMKKFGLAKKYMDIIFLDAIVRNGDRHEFNYGFITGNSKIDLAPNFDNNMSMFWNGIPTNLERKDVLVNEFKEVLNFCDYQLPELTVHDIQAVYDDCMIECKDKVNIPEIQIGTVIQFCMNAYNQL